MRFKGILLALIALTLLMLAIPTSSALACNPSDFDAPADAIWCEVRDRTPIPATPTPAPIVIAKPVAASAPRTNDTSANTTRGGDSPANAVEVSSNMQTINPGGRLWYKIGNDGLHIDVWVETYGQPGLSFAVYAPNQDIQSPDAKPKGLGTSSNAEPSILRWSGGSFLQRGNWYALVTNSNSVPVSYRIGAAQSSADKVCNSPYWEYINGVGVFWTVCK